MKRLTNCELAVIKDMVDELILSQGILDLKKLRLEIGYVDLHLLSRIAGQYYRLTTDGKFNISFSEIKAYLHLTAQAEADLREVSRCPACGCYDEIKITAESSYTPLCLACHHKLDTSVSSLSAKSSK